MYWKKQPVIEQNILIEILNQDILKISEKDIIKKCQLITSNRYCSYFHKTGKNKGLICGTVSKSNNGRCYTHSRKKNKNEIKNVKTYNKIVITVDIKLFIIFTKLYKYNNFLPLGNDMSTIFDNNLFVTKHLFIVSKETYDFINNFLFNSYKKTYRNNNLNIEIVEKNQQLNILPNINILKKSKKNKSKPRPRKIFKLNKNTKLNNIKDKMEVTLNMLDEKVPKKELAYTFLLLFKENKDLFKVYINLILSNINIFFKNVNLEIILNIWKNDIEYIQYERVLIYSDNNYNNIIEKVFSYVKGNYKLIPEDLKVLWVDFNRNSVIPYYNKYNIEFYKSGIKIYHIKDNKKQNPLPIDKITVLYY